MHGSIDLGTPRSTSFETSVLRLIQSNALLKSRKQIRGWLSGVSRVDNQLCSISRRHRVTDVPFIQPNLHDSILALIS